MQNYSDVYIFRDYVTVKRKEISQPLAMLRGLYWLEKEKIDFDWLIIISGQDYPVQPLNCIESFLKNTTYDGFIEYELIHENPIFHQRPWHTQCLHRYFYRKVHLFGREYEFKRWHPYRRGINCFAGSNWLNLSHKAVEYLWSKKDMTKRFIRYLAIAECSDETLFQTLLLNNSGLNIVNDYKRFILWKDDSSHPALLCLEHLDALVNSGAFFARKFDDTICPEILDRLDEILHIVPS